MIKYLKTRWKTGVLALLMVAVTAGILFLYDIPIEPVGYVAVFEMLLTGLGLMWDYHKYRKKQESLLYIRDCGNFSEEYLEAPENENEAIYREICRSLDEKRIEAENQRSAFGTELTDFLYAVGPPDQNTYCCSKIASSGREAQTSGDSE